ncbi:MAG: phospholipase D-like domain-containing protein [Gemmatimonadota bacterium]
MSRATASSRIDGNLLALQFDGPTTFDAWLEAIARAEHFVHFENYILRDDPIGRQFREALIERAENGVEVRVLYDWVGCWATPRRYWRPFRAAGVEVRAFNRPGIGDPLGVFQRGHRKLVVVDGETAFLGGFCVGQEWAGTDDEPPWRDTGVEIRGPAAAAAAQTFERVWAESGGTIPEAVSADPERTTPRGEVPVWLIEGQPWRSRVYRATQLMASWARQRLWITDPYFLAPRPVAESLMAAARDGVDVRILVPAHNNWPWVGSLSRGGFRSLLEAGVRIFEWQGPMIHAKTSVVDGQWCRIGSTNLNSASLLGNWELDVGVLDPDLASQVQALFLADLASAVEIVLPGRAPAADLDLAGPGLGTATLDREPILSSSSARPRGWTHSGQTLTIADIVRAGSALSDAIAGQRVLGREDRVVLWTAAILLVLVGALAAFFPRTVGWTIAILFGWIGLTLGLRAAVQARRARAEAARDEPH